jgi:hypothetical protein
MSPFSSFYDKAFNKNIICSQSITCNPCREDCRGVVIVKNLTSRTFNYVEQNGYLKSLMDMYGKMVAMRGG